MKSTVYCSILIFLLLAATSCQEKAGTPSPEPQTLTEALALYLEEGQSRSEPGLSILIQQNGAILYQFNKGLARLSPRRSIDPNTQFRTASVSKPITAIAIMMLVEEGLLSLDDKIVALLPQLPSTYADIRVKHLLAHSSGLLDYIDDNTNLADLHNFSNLDLIHSLKGSGFKNLQFAPGSGGDYSNTGYAILASVIEKASGMPFPHYLQTQLFEPLGMTQSFIYAEGSEFGDHGENYALAFGRTHLVLGYNSWVYGASGMISSTHDLSLFADALIQGKIISLENLNQITQVKASLPGVADYGYGWMTGKGNYWHSGRYSRPNDYWHTGGYDGYRTVLLINPDLDLQVIILTNNGEQSQELMFGVLERVREYVR